MLVDGSDSAFRRLIYRMIITEARLVEIRKAIAERVGVTGAQYTILMAILQLQGGRGISIGALADYFEVTGPHITGEIRKLSAQGMVRKDVNPHDKRGVLVRLTAEGRKRLLRAFEFICSVNDQLFDGVGVEEFKTLTRFHQKFMRNTQVALEWTRREKLQNRHAFRE